MFSIHLSRWRFQKSSQNGKSLGTFCSQTDTRKKNAPRARPTFGRARTKSSSLPSLPGPTYSTNVEYSLPSAFDTRSQIGYWLWRRAKMTSFGRQYSASVRKNLWLARNKIGLLICCQIIIPLLMVRPRRCSKMINFHEHRARANFFFASVPQTK